MVGKPYDLNHFDGIIPPRIEGDQLAAKVFSTAQKGALIFVTLPATTLVGQVAHIEKSGLYCFDGQQWIPVLQSDPLEIVALRATLRQLN